MSTEVDQDHTNSFSPSNPLKRKSPPNLQGEDHENISTGCEAPVDSQYLPGLDGNASQHDSKRSRRSQRAQPATGEGRGTASKQPGTKPLSPSQKRYSNGTSRPSKFLEGSMNDRASNKPPSPYLGEERAMEQYAASQSMSNRESVNTTAYSDAGIESSKPSGMYRFGKAIANAFNPSAWRGMNIWKEKEKNTPDPGKAILQERGERAQKAYAELKKSGFRGTHGASRLSTTSDIPAFKYDSAQDSGPTSFRNSAVDLDEYRSSTDTNKEDLRLARYDESFMPAPNVPLVSRSVSPMPTTSGRRSSLSLRTPSFQTLKNATSHIQLPSVKRHSAQTEPSESSQQIHKQPSRKDLAKQQKLSKRVSNLETQLETARRELELVSGSAHATEAAQKPGKKTFKPGALPSLPSERILNAHLSDDDVDDGTNRSGYMQTRSADRNIDPASQLQHELRESTATVTPSSSSRKRKGRYSMENDISHKTGREENQHRSTTSTRRASQPYKSPKVEFPNLQPSRPLRRTTSGLQNTSRHQAQQEASPDKPRTRRSRQKKDIPPVPSLPNPVDPSTVDKVSIISMRSKPNIGAGFGQDAEDALNLRKAYPLLTDAQVQDLLGKFRITNSKITDYTSTTHHAQTAPPALPPPSPVKGQPGFRPSISKSSLRSSGGGKEMKGPNNSPASVRPNNSPASARPINSPASAGPEVEIIEVYGTKGRARNGKFVKLTKESPLSPGSQAEAGDVVAELSPSKAGEKELPPYPKEDTAGDGNDGGALSKGGKGKPLPGVQREDYDWDEDIF